LDLAIESWENLQDEEPKEVKPNDEKKVN